MNKTITVLMFLFFIVFASLALGGTYMIYDQITNQNAKTTTDGGNTEVKVGIEDKSMSVEIKSALPGVIVFVFGVIGLLVMLIKVPIRPAFASHTNLDNINHFGKWSSRKLNYPVADPDEFNDRMIQEHLRKNKAVSVPLPVWWVIKWSNKYVRTRITRQLQPTSHVGG